MFDLASLASVKEVPVGQIPDAILYDPFTRRLFVFNGRGGAASVIGAGPDTVIATIPVGGKPEFAVTDFGGRIYVNIEDKSEVLSIEFGPAPAPAAECSRPRPSQVPNSFVILQLERQ